MNPLERTRQTDPAAPCSKQMGRWPFRYAILLREPEPGELGTNVGGCGGLLVPGSFDSFLASSQFGVRVYLLR